MNTQTCLVFCFTLILILIGTVSNTDDSSLQNNSFELRNRVFNESLFNESSPFEISSNQDFISKANLNNWTGNGTKINPFIIEKLRVVSTSESIVLVSIQDTTVYFNLQNNLLEGGLTGLRLENVTNGIVKNNTIRECISKGIESIEIHEVVFEGNLIHDINGGGIGIYFYECENSTIISCTIRDNAQMGLLLDYSENCTLIENNISDNNEVGINFRDSYRNLILRNNVSSHSALGMNFGNSWYCNITENSVFNTDGDGIYLAESGRCVLVSNLIYNNTWTGLEVWGPNNIVTNNTFYNNEILALRTHRNGNEARYNNFFSNIGIGEYYDAADNYGGNVFEYNYWSEWTWPDMDNDGIVDFVYSISGGARNNDSFPVVAPYHEPRLHILGFPKFFKPTEFDEILYSPINVTWGKVGDTHEHDVTYSLYYSTNGTDWTLIVSDLGVTTYSWNLPTSFEQQNHTIKVIARCSDGKETMRMHSFTIDSIESTTTDFWYINRDLILPIFVNVVLIVTVGIYIARRRSLKLSEK